IWSKIGKIAKVVLTVAAIIPSPIQGIAAVGLAVVNAVQAAKRKDWLGMIAAVASGVAAGVGTHFTRIANIAKGAAATCRGIQSIKRGGWAGIIGGAAGIAGGVCQAIGNGAAAVGQRLSDLSNRLQPISSAEAYVQANRGLHEAERNYQAALASHNPEAIAQAK